MTDKWFKVQAAKKRGPPNPGAKWIKAKKVSEDGIVFDSQFEALIYQRLKLDPDVMNLRTHVPFSCDLNGFHICRYTVDFTYQDRHSNKKYAIEAKGYWTSYARLRFKIAQAFYPEYIWKDIRQKDRKLFSHDVRKAIKNKD